MRRVLFEIPFVDWPIHGFGTMVLLGVLSALWILGRNARALGLDPQVAVDSAIWMVLAGLAGARIFYCVQFWEQFESDPIFGPLKLWRGGLVVYGSVVGGMLCFAILQRKHKLPGLLYFDAMAPAVAVGMGFGRLGCLFNGCCWGKVCHADFPLGIVFPEHSPPLYEYVAAGVAIQPTQVYASINAFLVAIIVWRIARSAAPAGVATGCLAVLYGAGRFTLENIRGDHQPEPGAWPVSQSISVLVVLAGAAVVWHACRRGTAKTLQN